MSRGRRTRVLEHGLRGATPEGEGVSKNCEPQSKSGLSFARATALDEPRSVLENGLFRKKNNQPRTLPSSYAHNQSPETPA
jgi:hypothetical protein